MVFIYKNDEQLKQLYVYIQFVYNEVMTKYNYDLSFVLSTDDD